jgi:hypothetical protein
VWIFAKAGFLSIVQHRDQPDMLMVRARVKGDIEHFFPSAKVIRMEDADYLYRTILPRNTVAAVIAKTVDAINYCGAHGTSFKSIVDKRRAPFYLNVWDTMAEMQDRLNV